MKRIILMMAVLSFTFAQEVKESDLREFSRVKINIAAQTKIKFGDKHAIEIRGPEKQIQDIEFDVNGRTLTIENKRDRRWGFWDADERDVKVLITLKRLTEITLNGSGDCEIEKVDVEEFIADLNGSADLYMGGKIKLLEVSLDGSGDIELDDLESNRVDISINGSGDVEMSGSASSVDVRINGSGDVKAFDMQTKQLTAKIFGSGDIRMTVVDEIKASIFGSGDITYKGNPSRVKESSLGSGNVRRYR